RESPPRSLCGRPATHPGARGAGADTSSQRLKNPITRRPRPRAGNLSGALAKRSDLLLFVAGLIYSDESNSSLNPPPLSRCAAIVGDSYFTVHCWRSQSYTNSIGVYTLR